VRWLFVVNSRHVVLAKTKTPQKSYKILENIFSDTLLMSGFSSKKTPRRHDYAVLTFLVLFPHPDPSDLPDRSLDVMSAVTPCHVPQTVTSDVPSTLACYRLLEK